MAVDTSLKITEVHRRPPQYAACRVTKANLQAVASWCFGRVDETLPPAILLGEGRDLAHPGDWLVLEDGFFVKYSDVAFHAKFESRRL